MKDTGATWTDERVELLKKLWAEGLSASRIAAAIGGITRNAVIGKVHRLGLSGRAKAKGSPTPRPRKKSSGSAAPSSTQNRTRNSEAAPSLKPVEKISFSNNYKLFASASMPDCERVTIMDLNDYVCRWPLGDPSTPEFRFCGGESVTGMPYCAYHCAMAYQPAQERKKERRIA